VESGHMGGDEALLRNFADVCRGRDESKSDLFAGLTSAAMCLATRDSVHRQCWVPIPDVRASGLSRAILSTEPTPSDLEPSPVSE